MMDVDELTAALAGPKPDRGDVLASFRRKHRRRKARQRLLCLGTVAVGVTVSIALATSGQSRPRQSLPLSPRECTPVALAHSLAQARQSGASILIADESPTGRTARSGYAAVVLHSVRTLSGPVVTSGTIAWTDGTAIGGAAPTARTTEATGGRVFAITWPAALVGSAVGPVLRAAPVVAGNVMFTTSGCTDAANLPGSPGSGWETAAAGSAPAGGTDSTALYAVPLQTVEEAASPAGDSNEGVPQVSPSRTAPGQGGDPSRGNGTGKAGSDNQGSGAAPSAATSPSANPGSGSRGSSRGSGNGNGQGNVSGSGNGPGSDHGRGKAGHQ
jgi:hypothetical protein